MSSHKLIPPAIIDLAKYVHTSTRSNATYHIPGHIYILVISSLLEPKTRLVLQADSKPKNRGCWVTVPQMVVMLYFDTTLQVKCNFEVTSFSAWYLLLRTLVLCASFKHSQKMLHFQVAHINFECCMKVKQHYQQGPFIKHVHVVGSGRGLPKSPCKSSVHMDLILLI